MKKRSLWAIAASILLIIITKVYASFFSTSFRDFERLLGKGTHFWKNFSQQDLDDIKVFKELYLKNYPRPYQGVGQERIPKTFHYIWLGPRDFPEKSKKYVNTWISKHPGWRFYLWTDRMDRPPPCPEMKNRDIAELCCSDLFPLLEKTDNLGERSDLLRYEILHRIGGIYLDHDIECFRSVDYLCSNLDFFACLEQPHQNPGIATRVFPCNALIACRPTRPILEKTIHEVLSRWDEIEANFQVFSAEDQALKVIHRTFHSFTLAVKAKICDPLFCNLLLPASFFNWGGSLHRKEWERWKKQGLVLGLHTADGTWRPQDQLSHLTRKYHQEHQKRRALERKYQLLKKAFILTFFLLSLSFYLYIWRKGKRIFVKNGR